MVDLVKVRRKAKEKKEEALAKAARSAESSAIEISVSPEFVEARLKASTEPVVLPIESSQLRLDRYKASLSANRTVASASSGPGKEPVASGRELLIFSIGAEQYAVPIESIAEIIEPRRETPVPNADPAVLGVISLRGTIVTIVDAGRKLGHAGAGNGPDARTIVVQREGELIGFKVDRISRVVAVAESEIETAPQLVAEERGELVAGVFKHDDHLSILLSLDELLT